MNGLLLAIRLLCITTSSYSLLRFSSSKLNHLHLAKISTRRFSSPSIRTEESQNISKKPSVEILKNRISQLRSQKEKQQIEMISTEIAIKKAYNEIKFITEYNSTTKLTKGTYDYGFVSKSKGSETNGTSSVPPSAYRLATENFAREWKNLLAWLNTLDNSAVKLVRETVGAAPPPEVRFEDLDEAQKKIASMKISNENIWKREQNRPQIRAPWVIKAPYLLLCLLLDALFQEDAFSRFYFLETVARMPYFSYITMIHTYETLGWWRRSTEAKRVHFAEEYNEYHHLMIWESLGGDKSWRVRFLAQHAAFVYYFVLIALWILSPSLAYNFSELIEAHAVDTYTEFAESNKDLLQSMEAPQVAKDYYEALDMYTFDEFQTGREKGSRRPTVLTLYDVVCCIRDDEAEHVKTMAECQDPEVILMSPNTEAAIGTAALVLGLLALYTATGGFSGGAPTGLESGTDVSLVDAGTTAAGANLGDAITAAAAGMAAKVSGAVDMAADMGLKGEGNVMEEMSGKASAGFIEKILGFLSKLRL